MKKEKQSKPVATPARCSLPAQNENNTIVLQLQFNDRKVLPHGTPKSRMA